MRSLHPAAADHRVSIRGSRCTALIHPFALEPSGGASLLLSTSVLQRERECGRYGNSSGGHGLAAIKFVLTNTLGVCAGQLPACFSTERANSLKEQHG